MRFLRNLAIAQTVFLATTTVLLQECAAAPPEQNLQIELKSAVGATRFPLHVADVALVSGGSLKLRDVIEAVALTLELPPGGRTALSRSTLARALEAPLGLHGARVTWSGAESVAISARSQHVDFQQVVAVAQAQLSSELASVAPSLPIRVLPVSTPKELLVRPGTVSYQARAVRAQRLESRMAVWVDVRVDGVQAKEVVVPFDVVASVPAYVARRDLHRGDRVESRDLDVRTVNLAEYPRAIVQDEAAPSAFRIRKPMSAGQVMQYGQAQLELPVMTGDAVVLRFEERGIVVETRAYAQADGDIGQRVKVMPTSGKGSLLARVDGSGHVLVGGDDQ